MEAVLSADFLCRLSSTPPYAANLLDKSPTIIKEVKMRSAKIRLLVLLPLVFLLGTLAWLTIPGTPEQARSLRFVGYIPLQRTGLLNVLDYLTVQGNDVFIAGISSGDVTRISTHAGSSLKDLAVLHGRPSAHGVAIDPATGLAFVSRSGVNTVEVFDLAQMSTVRSILVADDPDAIIYVPSFDSIPAMIYVAHGDAKTATLIDPVGKVVIATVALGGKAEFAVFDPTSGLLFQNLEDTNEIVALNLGTRAVVGRWPLAGCQGPSGLAIDGVRHRLIVACGGNSIAVIFDIGKHIVTASYPVGKHPDTMAYDGRLERAYSAGAFGQLTVLQGKSDGTFGLAETVRTHLGAHTLAVDPLTDRVYMGYAGLLVGPRIAVFEAEP